MTAMTHRSNRTEKRARACATIALLLIAIIAAPRATLAHGDVFLVGSTEPGGGALVGANEISEPFEVVPQATIGGLTLYSGMFPSFEWPTENDAEVPLYLVPDDTAIGIEITAIDSGASIKLGASVLDQVGQTAIIG